MQVVCVCVLMDLASSKHFFLNHGILCLSATEEHTKFDTLQGLDCSVILELVFTC